MLILVATSEDGTLDYSEKNWPLICQTGTRQTPIDFPSNFTYNKTDYISILSSNYSSINSTGLGILANHKFYLYNITNAGPLMIKKAGITYQYDLADIHYHITSEHTIKGVPNDIEMHLVHKKNVSYLNSTGVLNDPDVVNNLLVVGILYRADVSKDNADFAKFNFNGLGPIQNLDMNSYVSNSKNFYHYLGSLTTPTCEETVNWVVMEAVESISPAQLQYVKQFISKIYPAGNSRSVKPLNGRTIYYKQGTPVKTIIKTTNDGAYFAFNKILSLLVILSIILY